MSASAPSSLVTFAPLGSVYFPSTPGEPNFERISATITISDQNAIPCPIQTIFFHQTKYAVSIAPTDAI